MSGMWTERKAGSPGKGSIKSLSLLNCVLPETHHAMSLLLVPCSMASTRMRTEFARRNVVLAKALEVLTPIRGLLPLQAPGS
jgi:hypothetical protein